MTVASNLSMIPEAVSQDGKIGKKIVLEMLYERHSLALHKVAEDPRYFFEGLEDVVGSGAQVIAKSLVKQMHSKMGITESEMNVRKK